MPSTLQSVRALITTAALLALATACGGDAKVSADGVAVSTGAAASREPAMGPGDVKITSTDNVLVLSVIGDSVRMQLSDSLRSTVADNVDSSMKDKGAISSAIAKSVASVVNGAMGFVVAMNVNDIENLRFEDGHVKFEAKGGKTKITSSGDSQNKAQFTPEDAQKFIDAVHARQGPNNK